MEVILLERIDNLGKIGDRVNVKSGYGRNFLLPKGKAAVATPENIAIFEGRRVELEARQAGEMADATARADKIQALTLRLAAKAGPEGKLFGSIGTVDIAEACTAAGVTVERSEVRLPDGPIRTLGEHDVEVHLQTDVNVTVKIEVVSDGEPVDVDPVDAAAEDSSGGEDSAAPATPAD